MSGFQKANLGDVCRAVGIERYKASERYIDIISIFSKEIFVANLHFVKGIGAFYCNEGGCCEEFGLPQQYYILPVLKYSVRDVRKKDYGTPLVFQYLQVSSDVYTKDLLIKNDIQGDLTAIDLLVTCTDEKYQKNKFEVLGPAKWHQIYKESPEIIDNGLQQYMALTEASVARHITEEKMYELLNKKALEDGQSSRGKDVPRTSVPKVAVSAKPKISVAPQQVSAAPKAEVDVTPKTVIPTQQQTESASAKAEVVDNKVKVEAENVPSQNLSDIFNTDDIIS